jgi:hypothetical protein
MNKIMPDDHFNYKNNGINYYNKKDYKRNYYY